MADENGTAENTLQEASKGLIQENSEASGINTSENQNDSEIATLEAETEAKNGSDEEPSDAPDEGEGELSPEEIDALSDEEFSIYIKSGKLPDNLKDRIIKPDEKPKKEVEQETKQVEEKSNTRGKSSKEDKQESSAPPDYESVYKTIFKPFKANGKEITPRTVEDVISLMQMGANYTKKMQLMAPMKKAVQTLSNANIGEEELSFLIDLHKGNKEAIKQLLKRNEIDITDLDLDDIKYSGNKNNIASDDDVKYSDAIRDANASLPKIQEILDKQWDAESKKKVLTNPDILRGLHEEIEMGRFDDVQKIVDNEKTFGRYKDVPYVDAYIDVVTKLVQYQSMQQANKQKQQQQTEPPKEKSSTKSKAAPSRSKPTSKSTNLTVEDLMNMDEAEFNKLSIKNLM